MQRIISGIQQVGIGVTDADKAFDWYKKVFGMDVVVFNDEATANLMTRYTGDKAHNRKAILALNMRGGGGFEIWQYTSRTPAAPPQLPVMGDLGIFIVKMKCVNVQQVYEHMQQMNVELLTPIRKHVIDGYHFFLKDPFGNLFEVMECGICFSKKYGIRGGVSGVTVGVSNMEDAEKFYTQVLGYDKVLYKGEDKYADLKGLPGGDEKCSRVILTHSSVRRGAFAKLFGKTYIELVQVPGRAPSKIFDNRYWGDLGFIHVCFDINGMDSHEELCRTHGHPLTVNSKNSFPMGKAAGHFAYNEDPDGTLIEYVETHKVPILKKLGWYLDLKKRNPEKYLPDWMVGCLRFSRVK